MNYPQVLPASKKVNIAYNSLLSSKFTNDINLSLQYTLASPVNFSGMGLHTGKLVHVKLIPAPVGTGIVFFRTDLDDTPIPAHYNNVIDTSLSTVIASPNNPNIRIGTVEHIMSALAGYQINNLFIECNGPEMPVLDGSAAKFTTLLHKAGRQSLYADKPAIQIMKPVRVEYNDAFAEFQPSSKNQLSLSLTIDFPNSLIGKQTFDMDLTPQNFQREIAFCRTFTFKKEIDTLHKMGLAKGGSLQNAIVVDDKKILNPEGLYCPNEFVKHKMLDAIGDLSLAGHRLYGKFIGFKSGHKLNNMLLHALMKQTDTWRFQFSHKLSGRVYHNSQVISLDRYPLRQET